MEAEWTIEEMRAGDWPEVRAIYLQGIATGDATFETVAPEWDKWDASHLRGARLVAREKTNGIIGWAALAPVSNRAAYRGVAEVSVYVDARARGRGIGRALLKALTTASEASGIWTLQAGILAENVASIALHSACGFREVGRRERIGQLNGAWRDVVLMERRSSVVGTDEKTATD